MSFSLFDSLQSYIHIIIRVTLSRHNNIIYIRQVLFANNRPTISFHRVHKYYSVFNFDIQILARYDKVKSVNDRVNKLYAKYLLTDDVEDDDTIQYN